jgi:protein gp37
MSSDKVFIILTKRIERARDHLPKDWDENFQHVWLGITAGDQITFDKRWPYLSQIPASVYVISHEPALGLISYPQDLLSRKDRAWIIAGGESGTKSEPVRPSHQLWIRNDRDQCVVHGVPFFFKSWGEWVHGVRDCAGYQLQNMNYTHGLDNTVKWVVGGISVRVGRALSGRLIDGRTWDQVPQVSIGSNEPSLF